MKRRFIWALAVMMAALLTGLTAPALAEQSDGGAEYAVLTIPGSLGDLYGELRLPEGDGPVPLVVMCHGFGSSHLYQTDYARYFVSQGLATFSFDFCGGGLNSFSDGTMLEMSVLTEAQDLGAIIDHFRDDARFSSIMLWGESQGGYVSAYTAAQRPDDIAALVLEYPAFVLEDDAHRRAAPDGSFAETDTLLGMRIGRRYSEDLVSIDIYGVIGTYRGDVLIVHGDRDSLVPLSYSERALEVYDHAELVVLPGQNHGFTGSGRAEAMLREARFMRER